MQEALLIVLQEEEGRYYEAVVASSQPVFYKWSVFQDFGQRACVL